MTSFQGYEVVPAEGMARHSRSIIRITVSAKKVCLSEPLIRGMNNPSHIVFYRGVGENEGKIIIAAAPDEEDPERISISGDRKKVFFYNNDFVSMCGRILMKYTGETFKRGAFFSIMGERLEEEDAFVFDFSQAVEHLVKSPGYNGRMKKVAHPAFNVPRGYTGMM